MKAPGHGEAYPRLDDDRLPVVLVVLDGLGDRPIPELGYHTPAEAARTPVLDRLARRGASGWHLPFGWGPAPASELAHWAMFGFGDVPFPGRAVLEGLGAGIDVPTGVAATFAALRTSKVLDGRAWVTGRVAREDSADADSAMAALTPLFHAYGARIHPLGAGEGILLLTRHHRGDVTDSDPFYEELHPWLRVQAFQPFRPFRPDDAAPDADSAVLANELNALLAECRPPPGQQPAQSRPATAGPAGPGPADHQMVRGPPTPALVQRARRGGGRSRHRHPAVLRSGGPARNGPDPYPSWRRISPVT